PPDTNIVMIRVRRDDLDPAALSAALERDGVLILPGGSRRLRAVTHLDVSDEGIDRAIEALARAVG
ncbi:MAG: hypothetical protein V3T97_04935, partial [Gemmatimonadota bacterium]